MKKKTKYTQIILLFSGFFLILITYFLYPELKQKEAKKSVIINKELENLKDLGLSELLDELLIAEGFSTIEKINEATIDEIAKINSINKNQAKEIKKKAEEYISQDLIDGEEINKFTNVEYQGIYGVDEDFVINATEAQIYKKEPDIVYMQEMIVTLNMNDGRVVTIESDTGSYNKKTYDCFFVDNVKVTDDKTIIVAENLDLLASKDFASIYNSVNLDNESGNLKADKIDYDFKTKKYLISMYGDKKVKIKLVN